MDPFLAPITPGALRRVPSISAMFARGIASGGTQSAMKARLVRESWNSLKTTNSTKDAVLLRSPATVPFMKSGEAVACKETDSDKRGDGML